MSQGSPPNVTQEELQRLVAAELARQQHQQPPAPNGFSVRQGPPVIDLDEQLDRVDVSPQPVKIGGHVYMVRRDWTADEANELIKMIDTADQDRAAALEFWGRIVGADAEKLVDFIEPLPMAKSTLIGQQIAMAAGLGAAMSKGQLGEA